MAKIFISYSHQDEKWKNWLQSHLSVLEKQGKLDIWEDRQIPFGGDWLPEIEQSLNDSHIAILLISRHFLTSDFILGKETPIFLKRRQSDGLRVFPVIISPCAWQAVDWLSPIQGFPKNNKHLDGRKKHKIDEQFALLASMVLKLDKAVTESETQQYTPLPPEKIQVTKLPHTSGKLIGREKEFTLLDDAWANPKTSVLILKALGGTGKTALMKKWLDNLCEDNFRGANAVYTWSFYSQGSAEDKQASADEFFNKALSFFGYQGEPIVSPHDKGIKLAELINQQRTLLVLDGLEPLQYPVGTMHGDLKDKGILALLQQLAAYNQGLCLISSRQHVLELADKSLVLSYDLGQLQTADGVALLKSYGVTGAGAELEKSVNEVAGHALALNLLGNYIGRLLQGDIRKRDTISALSKEREEGKHAEKMMAAYETHLKGTRALSILYMMGLFDRPVSRSAIQHLRNANIPQLTDQLGDETDWQYSLDDLRQQQLLNSNDSNFPDTIDTHPLIREYFGKQLKLTAPDAWQQAHRLLYGYYKDLPEKQQPDTLEEMEPLFAAIAHGCAAELCQEALLEVYWPRIRREGEMYIDKKLGAFGADLSVLSHFFSQHWHTPAAELTDDNKASLFNFAALPLRALGRLKEAVQPMQAGLEIRIKQENWGSAAVNACNLSELQLTLGAIPDAITVAQQAVAWADKSDNIFYRSAFRTTLADAQHQGGQLANAQEQFEKAETLQKDGQAVYPQLFSLWGGRYCNLLLTAGKWQEVQQRAEQTYKYRNLGYSLLDIAMDQLSLGRASLQQAISKTVEKFNETLSTRIAPDTLVFTIVLIEKKIVDKAGLHFLQTAKSWLNQAVDGLRKAGTEDFLPLSLLARACYSRFFLCVGGEEKTLDLALADLQESYDIAQRGGMLLHLCDYHLESARLALTINKPVFKKTASEHTQKAKQLVEETGYKRRLPEVEYLQALLKQ